MFYLNRGSLISFVLNENYSIMITNIIYNIKLNITRNSNYNNGFFLQ